MFVRVTLQLCLNVAEKSTLFMCWWEAPTSGTFKWAAKQCCAHVLFVFKKNQQKKTKTVRQMINKHGGLETDVVDLAASS